MTEFERFYQAWLKKLDTVQIPDDMLAQGISGNASWDRRAAYLMFLLMKKQGSPQ